MNAAGFSIARLLQMRHSPVRNYVVPGLTSWLIGNPSDKGCVRLFDCSRDHQEALTPHSHRFDFQCWVLQGEVRNRIWTRNFEAKGDFFVEKKLKYSGSIGSYESQYGSAGRWTYADDDYLSGDCYSMKAAGVHSIYFKRDTLVLFFEGPTVTDESIALEPIVDGEIIPTMEVRPWMFQKGDLETQP